MAERTLPPAINGTELWLQAIHAELVRLGDLLTPAADEPGTSEPSATIELREPAGEPPDPEPEKAAAEKPARKSRTRKQAKT